MHWNLWLFFPAAGGAALVVALGWALSASKLGPTGGFFKPLPGATGTWQAGQSWAANLTAAGTVVTGLLAASSPVIKTVLGTTAPGKLVAMFVASAVASASAGAATVVTATFRTKGDVLTWAAVLGCWIGLAGIAGQLLVIADQASRLPLQGLTAAAWPLVGLSLALLALYGVSGLRQLLIPPPAPAAPAGAGAAGAAAAGAGAAGAGGAGTRRAPYTFNVQTHYAAREGAESAEGAEPPVDFVSVAPVGPTAIEAPARYRSAAVL
jgi:hypothetical protein